MIDYEALLQRYMLHVLIAEGTTAVPAAFGYRDDDPDRFSDEEWARLEAMSDEALKRYRIRHPLLR